MVADCYRQDLEVRVGGRAQGGVHAAQGRAVKGEAHVEQRAAVCLRRPLQVSRNPPDLDASMPLLLSLR